MSIILNDSNIELYKIKIRKICSIFNDINLDQKKLFREIYNLKQETETDIFKILVTGNKKMNNYYIISELDNCWSILSLLKYNFKVKNKIDKPEYELLKYYIT